MPLPKSDLKPRTIYFSPADNERADRIAECLGLRVAHGPSSGNLDRSAATREALKIAAEILAKKSRKKPV